MSSIDISSEDIDTTRGDEESSEDNEDGGNKNVETPQLNPKLVERFHTSSIIQNH